MVWWVGGSSSLHTGKDSAQEPFLRRCADDNLSSISDLVLVVCCLSCPNQGPEDAQMVIETAAGTNFAVQQFALP